MYRLGTVALALGAATLLGSRLAADDLKPGLKPGDKISPFDIKEVVGPDESNKGKSFCYV